MKESTYKKAFLVAALICVLLAAALGDLMWERQHPARAAEESDPVIAQGPAAGVSPAPVASAENSAAPLIPVQLTPERLQAIGVTTTSVEAQEARDELRVPGDVEVNEQRLAYVQTRFPGWIQKTFVNATYQYVRKGQPVFTIYSPELVSTEEEYLLAKKNGDTLDADPHGTAAHESGWLLQAASDRLRQFGVPGREIARLQQSGKAEHDITIESPASGYVTEFNALPNQYVQAENKLYTVADLSSVWVYANVPQDQVGQLRPGTPATVTVDAYPGRNFRGHIEQILPQVDAATRTVRVRLAFGNPGVVLKPGMYVNVTMAVPLGRQLMVPTSAVLHSGTREIAFVDHGSGYLEPRQIQTGAQLDDHVVILQGLRQGERVVSSANFLVDSESQLQAVMGSFIPPPPSGAGAQATSTAAEPVIEFSTEPTTPHKGTNLARVKLTGPDGKPVSGAEVTVQCFMAAMPEMGMAAMKSAATLSEKGNGVYEGPLQLQTGGTWQVTVVAKRGGQVVASRQVSMTATGGM